MNTQDNSSKTSRAAPMTPLTGVRVLDLSRYLPGPLLTSVLRDLGADVVKVESPRGDALRFVPPMVDVAGGLGAAYAALNAGKRRVTIDSRTPEGRATLHEMVSCADVLVESFRPGVLAEMGLDAATLEQLNPRLIACSLSGFGQTGPARKRAGHDLNYIARAGILGMFGPTGSPPQVPGVQLADVAGGSLPGVIAVLAALMERGQTGKGRHLDISLSRSVMALGIIGFASAAAGHEETRGNGFLTGGAPCYRCYETADGRHLSLGALEPHFFAAFCAGVGHPELAEHVFATGPRGDEVADQLAAAVSAHPLDHWRTLFEGRDVCAEAVLTPSEALAQPDAPTFRAGPSVGVRLDLGTIGESIAARTILDEWSAQMHPLRALQSSR